MERNYATQMDAARRGIVTPELKKVAEKEYMAVEDLMPLVASGKVAIPANKLHTCIDPEGIGSMLRTKINVNLGVSKDCKDYDVEMQKVLSAVNMAQKPSWTVEPRQYAAVPAETDLRMSSHDRHRAGI